MNATTLKDVCSSYQLIDYRLTTTYYYLILLLLTKEVIAIGQKARACHQHPGTGPGTTQTEEVTYCYSMTLHIKETPPSHPSLFCITMLYIWVPFDLSGTKNLVHD